MFNPHRLILPLSISAYGIALLLPGLAANDTNPYRFEAYMGYTCLLLGWTTAFDGAWTYFLPWVANVFFVSAILIWIGVPGSPRLGGLIALFGLALAALTFRIDTAMVNENGNIVAVHAGVGAWLWMVSFAILIMGFVIRMRGTPLRMTPNLNSSRPPFGGG